MIASARHATTVPIGFIRGVIYPATNRKANRLAIVLQQESTQSPENPRAYGIGTKLSVQSFLWAATMVTAHERVSHEGFRSEQHPAVAELSDTTRWVQVLGAKHTHNTAKLLGGKSQCFK